MENTKALIGLKITEALVDTQDPHALRSIIAALSYEFPYFDLAAEIILDGMGEPGVEQLIELLDDVDDKVRQGTIELLGHMGVDRVTKKLIKFLDDDNENIRVKTAEALGNIGDIRAAEALIATLKKDNASLVVEAAAWALGKIKDPRAAEPLILALQHENNNVKRVAAWALGEIKDPRAVPPLMKLVTGDSDFNWFEANDVRFVSIVALGKIGDIRAIEVFVAALGDKDFDVRYAAVQELIRIGTPVVAPVVKAFFFDEREANGRMGAVTVLGAIRDARSIEALIKGFGDTRPRLKEKIETTLEEIGEPAVEPLIRALALSDEDWPIKVSAIKTLGNIGGVRAAEALIADLDGESGVMRRQIAKALSEIGGPAVELLIVALGHENELVRNSAAEALDEIKDPQAVEPLIVALDHESEFVRISVVKALGNIGDIRSEGNMAGFLAAEALITTLKKDNASPVVAAAAVVLGKIGDSRVVEPLIVALGHESELVRNSAAEALGNIGGVRAAEALIVALDGESDVIRTAEPLIAVLDGERDVVRYEIALALWRIGKAAAEPLIVALGHENNFVRRVATEILGRRKEPRAVESLIAALDDEDWLVRIRTAEALGSIGNAQAVVPLIEILDDENEFVRLAIVEALGKIGDSRVVEPLIAVFKDTRSSPTLKGKAILALVNALPKISSLDITILESFVSLSEKAVKMFNDVELIKGALFALNTLLVRDNTDVDVKENIWSFYYSFIEDSGRFSFFNDPSVPPVFKSETANSIGFTLISILKKAEFAERREEYLKRIVDLSKERLRSKDRVLYMSGRFLAYNLNTLLFTQGLGLSEEIKEEIAQFNELNKGPHSSIFEDNEITVKIYFQEKMKEIIWVTAYINEKYGFKLSYKDDTMRIFEKKDQKSGRIARIIIPRAPKKPGAFTGSIFEDFNSEVKDKRDYVVYNGHAGMGTELGQSFKEAQAYFEAPIIQLACCWSKNQISRIQKLFPLASPILTKGSAMSLDGLLIFSHTLERLLKDGEDTLWSDVRGDIDSNELRIKWNKVVIAEESKGNRIFSDEKEFREISDIDGDGIRDSEDSVYNYRVVREFRNDLNLNFTPVADRETPEDKASEAVGRFGQYFSDDPFLSNYTVCTIDPETEGINKGWFWPSQDTQESIRVRRDWIDHTERYLISLNIGYRELSQESLMLRGLVEMSGYLGERFRKESLQAISDMENMIDIKEEALAEERANARESLEISEENIKDVFTKIDITTIEEKEKVVNPLRGFLVGIEYMEKKYKLAQRTIDNPESSEEGKQSARAYIEAVKTLYNEFLEKYNFPKVPFEDMIKILDVSKNNPTIWYLAYLVKNNIEVPEKMGQMNLAEERQREEVEMGMAPQRRDEMLADASRAFIDTPFYSMEQGPGGTGMVQMVEEMIEVPSDMLESEQAKKLAKEIESGETISEALDARLAFIRETGPLFAVRESL
ncbi:HEAT repeat domain-containing protein [Candidatus Omnitrophota bacterium]